MTKKELEEMNELRNKYQVLYEIHQDDVKAIRRLEDENSNYRELRKHFNILLDNLKKVLDNIEVINELENMCDGTKTYKDLPEKIKMALADACDW